jgi:hypothetical protein
VLVFVRDLDAEFAAQPPSEAWALPGVAKNSDMASAAQKSKPSMTPAGVPA